MQQLFKNAQKAVPRCVVCIQTLMFRSSGIGKDKSETTMNRRLYIYLAVPIFVLLGCGSFLESLFGNAVLVISSLLVVVAWGLVWMRLYRRNAHPELAVLTVLPYAAYYIVHATGSPVFSIYPAWANLYALSWFGFAAVAIWSVLPDSSNKGEPSSWRRDPVFLLLLPLIILFSLSSFTNYYSALT